MFSQYGTTYSVILHLSGHVDKARVKYHLACIVVVLLLIACVESNPRPVKLEDIAHWLDDLTHRLDNLMQELRDTRATLTDKIDNSVQDLTAKLHRCEDLAKANSARLDIVEQSQATMGAQLSTLLATNSNTAAPTGIAPWPTTAMPLAIEDVVREESMRATRQSNIVLTGILSSPPFADAGIVTNQLRDKLGINTMVTHCGRLGKPSADINRPGVLLVTLSSESNARAAIRDARKLCNSADHHLRDHIIFLNADLTPEQRKADYKLRAELNRHRVAWEADLIIRNGKLQTKTPQPPGLTETDYHGHPFSLQLTPRLVRTTCFASLY